MLTVTVYLRPGCHLCEEALSLLRQFQRELPFHIREVDIRGDRALLERYDWFIPVIEVDGDEVMRAPVDPTRLRAALRERADAR